MLTPLLLSFAVPEKLISVDAPGTALAAAAEIQGVDEGRGDVSPIKFGRSHSRVVHDAAEK